MLALSRVLMMTAQQHDLCDFQGTTYQLVGVRGYGLFEPREYGLRPGFASTSCERGYVCHYVVAADRLTLTGLSLSTGSPPPMLLGVRALTEPRFGFAYRRLRCPIEFSGQLLIGTEFISELYIHMGFQPAWKYRSVLELAFDEGRLLSSTDRSDWAAAERMRMGNGDWQPGREELPEWIARSFRLDF